ncbi:amino acid ABC transporter permease [Chelatococcus asaccharovorans]|uniref:Amino acid ABC transporter membrane protein 1 (PAAT family) n=1 Tax=Chelatococcus asaccharovorans TaxID=28210 RepID=A0A2V3UI24_9HYPH|nr:amino acid ABC transporter permease [Chelatococcus asaccharovorans]MBS7701825.1 amino acid ABC transporter permease [Chelatococcus asaccharovorans]PXW64467.1 amino acid ABC transporter membrane protein 1 (PAAT family) [Chelatococcus asaccharovorans]CAH1665741.1 Amino acid ABC transporter membrane protein 1 (PAAT family) [Chelatococcus asaccharovorans]CAH1681807.1 Amino acid ABC transporter membrane protein 1 (PAAT family) [Chelatococcus asaccharovorans]
MSSPFDWSYFWSIAFLFLKGLEMTLFLAVICNALAVILAYVFAAAVHFRIRVVREMILFYVSVIRNTPLLVQIFFFYFGMPEIGVRTDPTTSGIIVLTLWASAYQTANLRGGIDNVPRALTEAMRALGLRPIDAFVFIVVPVATRAVVPAMMNTMVSTIKNSALLSAIGVPELTFVAMDNIAETYRAIENFVALLIGYLAIVLGFSAMMTSLERYLGRGYRR